MAAVETRHLCKVYREGQPGAVEDVDLTAREGELLVLLGPRGSGKTTLLRMIAGLETPTRGEVLIDGRVVNHLAARERRIAMLSQSCPLYSHLTVREDLLFHARVQGLPEAQHRVQVDRVSSLLGIDRLLDQRLHQLSFCEQQRVALARALLRSPAVFLLDDPLARSSAGLRASAEQELAAYHERLGTTIYVTHDQEEALRLGQRVAVLQKGTVRQVGTPAEIYEDPADTFVAGFFGSPPMNLLASRQLIVGFRPEHLLPREQASGARVELRFRITSSEPAGEDRLLRGSLEGTAWSDQPVASRLPAAVAARLEVGAVAPFAVAERQLRFFDRDTEKRTAPRAVSLH